MSLDIPREEVELEIIAFFREAVFLRAGLGCFRLRHGRKRNPVTEASIS